MPQPRHETRDWAGEVTKRPARLALAQPPPRRLTSAGMTTTVGANDTQSSRQYSSRSQSDYSEPRSARRRTIAQDNSATHSRRSSPWPTLKYQGPFKCANCRHIVHSEPLECINCRRVVHSGAVECANCRGLVTPGLPECVVGRGLVHSGAVECGNCRGLVPYRPCTCGENRIGDQLSPVKVCSPDNPQGV